MPSSRRTTGRGAPAVAPADVAGGGEDDGPRVPPYAGNNINRNRESPAATAHPPPPQRIRRCHRPLQLPLAARRVRRIGSQSARMSPIGSQSPRMSPLHSATSTPPASPRGLHRRRRCRERESEGIFSGRETERVRG
jgi:hypothetical protein